MAPVGLCRVATDPLICCQIAAWIYVVDQCSLDATCRSLLAASGSWAWRVHGEMCFVGMELGFRKRPRLRTERLRERRFGPATKILRRKFIPSSGRAVSSWRMRFRHFAVNWASFVARGFDRTGLLPRKFAVCRLFLQTDVLAREHAHFFAEFEVGRHAGLVSLVLVDSGAAGRQQNCVKFFPHSGKVSLAQVEPGGRFEQSQMHILAAPTFVEFAGKMAVFMFAGRYLVFCRRWSIDAIRAMRALASSADSRLELDAAAAENFLRDADCADGSGEPLWESTGYAVGTSWCTSCTIGVGVGFTGRFAIDVSGMGNNPPFEVTGDHRSLGQSLAPVDLAAWHQVHQRRQ